eukprot:TRINITY_DN3049_c0_g1_i1.p1 TRINITY_DN3049_c0_g1~~TRINITY_DN3049_c0_g1_i1.p1  ORF type:complete len:443 (+),score=97.90 TRINITY_DN3049_c0_g1_i1:287-1615(+)
MNPNSTGFRNGPLQSQQNSQQPQQPHHLQSHQLQQQQYLLRQQEFMQYESNLVGQEQYPQQRLPPHQMTEEQTTQRPREQGVLPAHLQAPLPLTTPLSNVIHNQVPGPSSLATYHGFPVEYAVGTTSSVSTNSTGTNASVTASNNINTSTNTNTTDPFPGYHVTPSSRVADVDLTNGINNSLNARISSTTHLAGTGGTISGSQQHQVEQLSSTREVRRPSTRRVAEESPTTKNATPPEMTVERHEVKTAKEVVEEDTVEEKGEEKDIEEDGGGNVPPTSLSAQQKRKLVALKELKKKMYRFGRAKSKLSANEELLANEDRLLNEYQKERTYLVEERWRLLQQLQGIQQDIGQVDSLVEKTISDRGVMENELEKMKTQLYPLRYSIDDLRAEVGLPKLPTLQEVEEGKMAQYLEGRLQQFTASNNRSNNNKSNNSKRKRRKKT